MNFTALIIQHQGGAQMGGFRYISGYLYATIIKLVLGRQQAKYWACARLQGHRYCAQAVGYYPPLEPCHNNQIHLYAVCSECGHHISARIVEADDLGETLIEMGQQIVDMKFYDAETIH
jgi:hypothetical protein